VRRALAQGIVRGADSAPESPCVVRSPAGGPGTLARTVRDDVQAISEQADVEGDDAPAGADRAWP
jgi:hypothetical protein